MLQTSLQTSVTRPAGSLHTLVTHPRYTPSLHTLVTQPRYTPQMNKPGGPVTALFSAACVAFKSCNQGGVAEARFVLPRYRPRYRPRCVAVTYLVADPTPARASDPPFCRCHEAGAAEVCFASLRTSLHSRHTPRYRPNQPQARDPPFCRRSGNTLCVLRFALPRYRPRGLVTDPTPGRGIYFRIFFRFFLGIVFAFGFLASWLLGFLASWLLGWLLGFLASRLLGFWASWLLGFLASWLLGFLAFRLLGFSASGLLGFSAFCWFMRLLAALAFRILCIPSSSSPGGVFPTSWGGLPPPPNPPATF